MPARETGGSSGPQQRNNFVNKKRGKKPSTAGNHEAEKGQEKINLKEHWEKLHKKEV